MESKNSSKRDKATKNSNRRKAINRLREKMKEEKKND